LKKGITLIAALAVVLAITSGAFAAGNHLITASSQIKDGAVSWLDLSPTVQKALKEKGPKGDTGARGPQGPKGDTGVGGFGPVHLSNQTDNGCATSAGQEAWAKTASDRSYTVEPLADGSGYQVTRYDLNGTFKTIPGAKHPGCDDVGTFSGVENGTWTGVWTRTVTSDMAGFDYNPDADLPASGTWNDFLTAVFNLDPNADPTTTSYEFDYYNNDCDAHWRDSFYSGSFEGSGTIEDC
jgi:hypothetical protein